MYAEYGKSPLKLLSRFVYTAHSFYACKEQINAKKAFYIRKLTYLCGIKYNI